MRPLRIVLILPNPPLPFGNAAARWFYVLFRGLVERGHQVTAIAACDNQTECQTTHELFPSPQYTIRTHVPEASRNTWEKLRGLHKPSYNRFSAAFRQDADTTLAQGCDILHLEQLWSGWVGWKHAAKALIHVHFLYAIDQTAVPASDLSDAVYRQILRRAEPRILRHFPHVSSLTPRLTEAIRQIAPKAVTHTVPLGIDLSLYPFTERALDQAEGATQPVVSLIGSFNWRPTFSAGQRLLTRLWPEILRRVPNARLRLVGRCARQCFAAYEKLPEVTLFENVPDTQPFFTATDVMIYAPSAGSGMKVKVLEAFALGAPVVTNIDGVEGIPAIDGIHAGIAEDDAGLIDRTVALLQSAERRSQQRNAARQLVEAHCSPDATLTQLEAVYAAMRA